MKRLLFLGLLVVALGAFGLGIAMAQEGGDGNGSDEPKPADELIARVAEKLGISEEQLRTAFQDAEQELVDEAVAEGRLTEEQATRIRERISEGRIFPPFHRPDHKPYPRVRALIVDSAATVLGLDKDALIEQLRSGQSLAEVAEAQGMNVEDFKTALLAQVKENLDAKVADGDLTQEKADRIFGEIEEYIDRIVNYHFEPHDGPRHRAFGPGGGPRFHSEEPPEE